MRRGDPERIYRRSGLGFLGTAQMSVGSRPVRARLAAMTAFPPRWVDGSSGSSLTVHMFDRERPPSVRL